MNLDDFVRVGLKLLLMLSDFLLFVTCELILFVVILLLPGELEDAKLLKFMSNLFGKTGNPLDALIVSTTVRICSLVKKSGCEMPSGNNIKIWSSLMLIDKVFKIVVACCKDTLPSLSMSNKSNRSDKSFSENPM